MSSLRFNHVFRLLLILSAAGAFFLPARISNVLSPQVQMVFAPIASPTRAVASRLLRGWGDKEPAENTAASADLADENHRLRMAVASLTEQLNALKQINTDRQLLGDVRWLCSPVAVIGAGTGPRESLILSGSLADGLRAGQPVIYTGGIAGRIDRIGPGGAQVRLITDKGFRAEGAFGRFIKNDRGQIEFVRIAQLKPLVEGIGNGQMAVLGLDLKQVQANLTIDDWVILNDPPPQWPMALQGYKLGRIVSIAPRGDAPLFADIRIRPTGNPLALREVMVMTRY